jgi:hypothetical protein
VSKKFFQLHKNALYEKLVTIFVLALGNCIEEGRLHIAAALLYG